MAFQSFKYKFYSKGYHCSAQKSATAFFESSYQYLRRNQGLVSQETWIPSQHSGGVNPHPVVGASVNYNTVEYVLQKEAADENGQSLNKEDHEQNAERLERRTREGRRQSFGATSSLHPHNGQSLMSRVKPEELSYFHNQKNVVINQKLSQSYYSTATNTEKASAEHVSSSAVAPVTQHRAPILEEPPSETLSPWEPDTEESLNPQTFLRTQEKEIRRHFEQKNFNKINALYQSLKRNEIVPSLEIYSMVIESVCKRSLDNDNLDNRMFHLLSCYQDLITNKLRPTEQIYNMVIGALFEGSIMASVSHNDNGLDFYKIAVDLFRASNAHKNHEFSKSVLDFSLLAMNLYPGYVQIDYVRHALNNSSFYVKDAFYYVAMLLYARSLNDNAEVKRVYGEFRNACALSKELSQGQYEVYSAALMGLVETGDLPVAIKLLDKVLSEIREEDGRAFNIAMILSNFILSVSKLDSEKAYNLLLNFAKLRWVPDLSYEFHLALLSNSMENWDLSKKIYDYIYPMRRVLKRERHALSDYLLSPADTHNTFNVFLGRALQLNETETVMKIVEESVVKSFKFDVSLYGAIFRFFKEIKCPEDYLLRFISTHGNLMEEGQERFEFLNGLIESYQSQVILTKVTEMPFFADSCRCLKISDSKIINHSGLIACFQSLWRSPQTIEKYGYNLELHGIVISRFCDLESYYAVMENEFLLKFKEDMTERFQKLVTNYRRLNLDPTQVSATVVQATKMIDMPEELTEYFAHPGDWDKSYPLNLGSMIRNSYKTGLKSFTRLRESGYCFDYDTYRELIHKKKVDENIISMSLKLCTDDQELKYLANCLVVKTFNQDLERVLLLHADFRDKILPHLKDESLLRIAKNTRDIQTFIQIIDFPARFQGISSRVENRSTVDYIYDTLFKQKKYELVVELNDQCPVMNIPILLKSAIRSGDYARYEVFCKKFQSKLGDEGTNIKAEFLINNGKVDEALKLLESALTKTKHQTGDLYTFALFLKSFDRPVSYFPKIENTLQLANILSAQDSFQSQVALYQTMLSENAGLGGRNLCNAVAVEISDQLLNNLSASLQFIDLGKEKMLEKIAMKLGNFYRMRVFMKLPVLEESTMQKLLHINSIALPDEVDNLFNNIVETIYLNPNTRQLYLKNDLIFNFQSQQMIDLIDQVQTYYEIEKNDENAAKAKAFSSVLKKLYYTSSTV